jgi:prophage regulatory protein
MKKESVNSGHDTEPEHHESPPKSTAHAKRQKDLYDDPLNNATKGVVIIRLKQVQIRTGLSRSTIYDRINPKSPRFDSTFPKQISLGSDAVGWIESEVNDWLESRISVRRDER